MLFRSTMIKKSSKSKGMALKAKSSDTDESSNDEDSKMKSYITRQFKKFTIGNPILSLRAKTKGRKIQGMAVNTLFPQDLSALGVKASIT